MGNKKGKRKQRLSPQEMEELKRQRAERKRELQQNPPSRDYAGQAYYIGTGDELPMFVPKVKPYFTWGTGVDEDQEG